MMPTGGPRGNGLRLTHCVNKRNCLAVRCRRSSRYLLLDPETEHAILGAFLRCVRILAAKVRERWTRHAGTLRCHRAANSPDHCSRSENISFVAVNRILSLAIASCATIMAGMITTKERPISKAKSIFICDHCAGRRLDNQT